jgi:hypothetical protein
VRNLPSPSLTTRALSLAPAPSTAPPTPQDNANVTVLAESGVPQPTECVEGGPHGSAPRAMDCASSPEGSVPSPKVLTHAASPLVSPSAPLQNVR